MTLLVTWLWQGTAIAGLTMVALRMMPRLSAATRHRIWWFALVAVLLLPIADLVATLRNTGTSHVLAEGAGSLLVLPAIDGAILVTAGLVWAAIAALGLVRIVRAWRTVSRLKEKSSAFDAVREAKLSMWTRSRMSGRQPQLRTGLAARPSACALGLGPPPVILVSQALCDALDDAELDDIVMHERAHLERRDDWLRLLQAIASSLVGLHPAVRFITRQIDVERESACDDAVVVRADARRYARSLITAAEATAPFDAALQPAAARQSSGGLRARIARLLDPRRNREARPHMATSMTCAVAMTCALLIAPRLSPLVVFTPSVPLAIAELRPASVPDVVLAVETRPAPATFVSSREPARVVVRPIKLVPPSAQPVPAPAVAVPVEPPADAADRTSVAAPLAPLEGGRIVGAAVLAPITWTHTEAAAAPPSAVPDVAIWSSAAATSTAVAVAAAAVDASRIAEAVGARATSAGVSIGRVATRAGVGLASGF